MELDEACFQVILEVIPKQLQKLVSVSPATVESDDEPDLLERFLSRKVPATSLADYVARFHDYSDASPSCFLLAWIYIERLKEKLCVAATPITPRHIHRLVFTAWMTACKFFDDQCVYTTSLFCKIGGISSKQSLNKLEAEFLCLLGFDLCVSGAEFAEFCAHAGLSSSDKGLVVKSPSRLPPGAPVYSRLHKSSSSPSLFTCEEKAWSRLKKSKSDPASKCMQSVQNYSTSSVQMYSGANSPSPFAAPLPLNLAHSYSNSLTLSSPHSTSVSSFVSCCSDNEEWTEGSWYFQPPTWG